MGEAQTQQAGFVRTAAGLAYEIRPWQWYKQGVILIAIVFSKQLFDPMAWGRVSIAVAAFCAVAGATYIFNDISDVEEDRKHPDKRNRPIASGQVGVQTAGAFAVALLVAGFALSYTLGPLFVAIIVAYLVQNAAYSLYLKDVVLVDVLLIAIGFVLRAVAGVVAIGVALSPWLVVCTFLAALLLALGKRRHEFAASEVPGETRATLADYTTETLDQLLGIVISTLLMSYSIYTFTGAKLAMMLTLPFAFFGVFRYHHLVYTTKAGASPGALLVDRQLLVNFVFWGLIAVVVLYGRPRAWLVGVFG
ncbi:phosphoribose diphosphate:decaprenyl-phosphate phosphoribosyltransferase [Halococcus morrhuae DSM 1307]|uniref:Phosphoribose diphosphate:decaprenyl-phosphate phosphoribosyltransferase n=1 Tax=Halococcus morrhuae DSM 1307 TaxID=931277 RepID=M0MUV3_HALMO|nr:decaprenyl-phosphate phosphoribosyltransferase [Halococcus morrhuae]EMA49098.1 phosphoribose diphosphate:decaprenyl-phosphate phosphoribosyltransferase [Halococcus morrhuae DSM 1307]